MHLEIYSYISEILNCRLRSNPKHFAVLEYQYGNARKETRKSVSVTGVKETTECGCYLLHLGLAGAGYLAEVNARMV